MRLRIFVFCLNLILFSLVSSNICANCSRLIEAVRKNDFDQVFFLLSTRELRRKISAIEYKKAILFAADDGNAEIFFMLSPFISDNHFFKYVFKILLNVNYQEVVKFYTFNRKSSENDD